MLWKKIKKFWTVGFIVTFMITGCSEGLPEVSEPGEMIADREVYPSGEDDISDAESTGFQHL